MTKEPSPRPWRVGENSLGWKSCIEDANGKQIASCWGGDGVNCTEPAQSDAALIVDAVNALDAVHALSIKLYDPLRKAEAERDRLRDIVRRMLPFVEYSIDAYRPTSERRVELTREARAAIGEGETPTGKGVGV